MVQILMVGHDGRRERYLNRHRDGGGTKRRTLELLTQLRLADCTVETPHRATLRHERDPDRFTVKLDGHFWNLEHPPYLSVRLDLSMTNPRNDLPVTMIQCQREIERVGMSE